MRLSQIKKTIETNVTDKKNPLEGLSVNSTTIFDFLQTLVGEKGVTLDKVDISQPNKKSLQISMVEGLTYSIVGNNAGMLEVMTLSVTITQEADEVLWVELALEGVVILGESDRRLSVQGNLSDPDSGVLTLTVVADDMPQLAELALEMGVPSVTESLQSVGLSLPVLDQINLDLELLNQKVTELTATGSMTLGAGVLDMTCSFIPEVVIEGGIQSDSQVTMADLLTALPIDATELPSSQLTTLRVVSEPKAKTYRANFVLSNDWAVDLGGSTLALTSVDGTLDSDNGEVTAQFNGTVSVGETALVLSSTYVTDQPLTFTGTLGAGQQLSMTAVVDDLMGSAVDFPSDVPDLSLTTLALTVTPKTGEFSLKADAMDPWEIPVGVTGLQLDDISLDLNRAVNNKGKKTVSGVLGGELDVAGASFRSEYAFPGDFVIQGNVPSLKLSPVLQDLCGGGIFRDIPIPSSVLAVDFSNISITVDPKNKFFSLGADSALGLVELTVKKIASDWGFAVGFLPPATWAFSSIASELSVLDGLNFSDTALVLSSSDDRALVLTRLESSGASLSVQKGFNFLANMNMQGLGVDELLGIERLNVYAAIGGNPADMVIEAGIDGEFQLSDGVAFGDVKFRLQPAPSNFSLTLLGTVTTILDNSRLDFVGGMQVQPRSAVLQASMLGTWNEPFDTKGVAIANVALDLGVSFPPPLPTVGIAGSLQVGDFQGAVAVKFDSAMPSRSMLAVAFNRLYLMDVISTFCGASVARSIPSSLANTVLNIGFEDVNVYIVPQATNIGELQFDQGFYLAGKLNFWGLRASASLAIDYLEGTELKAEVEPINIGGGIFKLTGAAGQPNASMYFKLSPNPTEPPVVKVSGAVELLGIRSETYLDFSDSGFHFLSTGKIFDLFQATLDVKGNDLTDGGSIWVKASMQNDLLSYLREKATAAIQAAADSATRELTDAQNEVRKAQDSVNSINSEIDAMRRTVQRERDRDLANIRSAQSAVNDAQRKVDSINGEINSMRQTIRRERERDTQNLRNAQREVSKAQGTVNSLQHEINSTKNRIEQLKRDIDNKKRWFDRSKWYEKSYRWAEYSAYAAAKGTEIGALYTKIGGIETAKATAIGALEIAKQTLRGIEAGAKTFPIDADPRIVGLFTALGTATGALEAAKLTLKGIEAGAKTFPIDADPRILALFTARETANAALEVAIFTLEGIKKSVGAIADVGQFIAEVGLGGLLDVRSAQFEGSLQATEGGSVSMAMEVVFMKGSPQTLSLAFNFQSPQQAALDLAKKLLPA